MKGPPRRTASTCWQCRRPTSNGRRPNASKRNRAGRRAYRRSDLVLAATAIDRNTFPKDKVRNRTDTGIHRPGRFRLDAAVLRRIECNGTRLVAVETMAGCDVGQHLRIGDVLRCDEVGIGDGDGEPMLGVAPGGGEDQRMRGLGRIGPELATEIQVETRRACFSSGRAKAAFGSVMP